MSESLQADEIRKIMKLYSSVANEIYCLRQSADAFEIAGNPYAAAMVRLPTDRIAKAIDEIVSISRKNSPE